MVPGKYNNKRMLQTAEETKQIRVTKKGIVILPAIPMNSQCPSVTTTPCTSESKEAYHLGIEVGNEESGSLIHSVGAPVLWVCQEQDLLPILKVGNDLEGFGHLASCEAAHDLAHSMIDFNHLGVKARGDQGGACLPTA